MQDGSTALINASFLGQAEVIKLLLARPEVDVTIAEEAS